MHPQKLLEKVQLRNLWSTQIFRCMRQLSKEVFQGKATNNIQQTSTIVGEYQYFDDLVCFAEEMLESGGQHQILAFQLATMTSS